MAKYLGNIVEDATINFKFHTTSTAAVPTTLAGTPAVKVYKDNATGTETATGVTLSVDFDSVTGLNNVAIDTSADAFYATGSDYQAVITTGTVDSVSVVGAVVAEFSIENRFDEVDMTKVHGSALTETSAGYLAAGFVKQYDVASPVLTSASVNQTGDAYANQPTNFNDLAVVVTTGEVTTDSASRTASKATGFATPTNVTDAHTTTDGLVNGIVDPSAADIADAVWEEDIADHTTVTKFGGKNQKVVPSETIGDYKATGFATPTNVTDAHATTDGLVNGIVDPSAADVADAVWEEAIADHSTGTTFGGKNQLVVPSETLADYKATGFATPTDVTNAHSTTDGLVNGIVDPSAADIADAVWEEDIADHTTVTKFGGKNQKVVPSETLSDYKATGFATPTNVTDAHTATDADIANVYTDTQRVDALIEDSGGDQYTTKALSQAPSGSGGDATEAKQDTMIASLAAAKGSGFVEATDSQEAIRNRGDAAWTGTATDGAVPVNHDTGGTDTLLVTDENDVPLGGAVQRAYRKVDYDASSFVVRASATTDDNGEWGPIYLSDGVTYTLVANYQGRIATAEVTPAA
jgi:hypothetical protein